MKYISRILTLPRTSFFLLGPRGTGKSTWLRRVLPRAHWVDLLSEETYQRLLADPASFAAEIRAVSRKEWIIVDEIQRLPNLLNEVHRAIEGEGRRFVLCGSSARKLRRAGVNLLAGRAVQRFMHPFLPEELGGDFNLKSALEVGLLPLIWGSADRRETLRAYAELYLKQEIQAEAIVRNLPGFARFLPVSALLHGETINITNIARDAGIARTTASGYLEILEETLLGFRLPAYEAKLRVRERKLPKWYWCDPGIVRSMKKSAPGSVAPEERGALFEGLVAQLLRAYRDYRGLCDELAYWAPAESRETEVDFLLKRGERFIAIEAKSGSRFSNKWCRGLRAIHGLRGLGKRIVVYPEGPQLRTEDGIDVLPFSKLNGLLVEGGMWSQEI